MKLVAAALVAVAASWMLAGSAAGQAAEVRVVVNGVDVPLAAPAVVFNGQVMAPMSGLFEPMGAIAAYYETDRSIVVTNPDRLVVDFINANLRTQGRQYAVGDAGVDRIRTAQFQVKPFISRMVFDLNQPVEISITSAPTSYLVTLQVRPRGAAPWQAPGSGPNASPLTPGGPVKVTAVGFQSDGLAGRITVDSTGPMEAKIREFAFPDRL